MFFKKKKTKVDPRIRFQNRQFNQKLQKARTYQRTARAIPEGSFKKFLQQIGLGSIWRQLFAGLIAAGIIYLVYIPNFLTLQTIAIEGLSDGDRTTAQTAIDNNLRHVPFYNPQRNLLFLSKRRLNETLLSLPAVDHVNFFDKDLKTKSIKISVTAKYERFLVRSADSVYDVYNDGSTKGVAGIDRNYWEGVINPSMVKVQTLGRVSNPSNQQFLTPNSVAYINSLQKEISGITGSTLAYIQIPLPEFKQPLPPADNSESSGETVAPDNTALATGEDLPVTPEPQITEVQLPLNADELDIFMQKGNDPKRLFRVIVDTSESAHDLVQRLNLLLSQTAPDRYNALDYIDLRVKARAFVCLLNAPCHK